MESAAVPDAPGVDLKPDPMTACTGAEFVKMMGQLRVWAGSPSLRVIAAHSQQGLAPSTLSVALRSAQLPTFNLAVTFARACGCTEDEVSRWATAWRTIALTAEGVHRSGTTSGAPEDKGYRRDLESRFRRPDDWGWIE